jgi:hypothetical protein
MSLQEKILKLRMDAVIAARHAAFWQKAILEHGEAKATAFYTHLGLNHLEKKSVEWEGLTLSREPREHEKIAVKGIAGAQESAKEKISTILLNLRTELITDGLKGIKKLSPAKFHELTLQASAESRSNLRDRLVKVHRQGRLLVAAELSKKQDVSGEDEFDDLDTLTDVTDARVVNDVQSRIIAAASRFTLLGLADAALNTAIQNEIEAGSVSYIDRTSTGLANRVISIGRGDEMRSRADEISRYEYSSLLDQNTCSVCLSDDGKEASSPEDLPDTPNPDCQGSDYCRCFIVAIVT